ncbi:MAG: hypothetical protein M0R77_19950 [Gammaproteobacteria bacterium]|nr:hypothetical protein [Gammaproteobacteria bacterium]
MGSMVIFHYTSRELQGEDAINVMMPNRISQPERQEMFNRLMLDGYYQPAYVIQSDDLDVAFDCGNGYPPAGIECLAIPNTAHTSTSVGDIVVVNGTKKMLVMPLGFEEI